ncbi:MAG: transporter ATP-binding protein [Paenibacillus sp.]|jgi:ABC-2 type transport system ATP-binding protein|nr:transporter ATP-binding protein [Paenibacillus sp.]
MTLVNVQRLVKRFGAATAVDGLSFEIGEGRCIALLGPNGAGKTTTLNMLAGLLKPTSGDIRFAPLSATLGSGRQTGDIRRLIGYLPQYPAFYNWMSGREYLTFSGRIAHLSKEEAKRRAEETLATVGLSEAGNRRIGGYSGGMKQRLGIAQAIIHRPRLLLLDEPVSALDPIGRREVLDMIRLIREETTVLFSTHVLHDAEAICDDILIMNCGSIVVSGTLAEVRRQFSEPVIKIQAETPLDESVKRWKLFPFVTEVEAERYEARLSVTDLEEARMRLWRDLAEHAVPVVRLEAGRTTLEDLFIKAVKAR